MNSRTLDVLIDTREQKPLKFPAEYRGWKICQYRCTLPTGDYSVKGHAGIDGEPRGIAIERKATWNELLGNLRAANRPRLIREFLRLRMFHRRLLIVTENSLRLETGACRSSMPPHVALREFHSICQAHGVHGVCLDPEDAPAYVLDALIAFLEAPRGATKRTPEDKRPVEFTAGMASRIGDRLATLETALLAIMEQLDQ